MPPASIIHTENLSRSFGAVTAVDNLSIDVPRGIVFGFLGPNGAGKTTTLRTASGLKKPTSGTIVVDGRDITAASPQERVKLGLCQVPEGRRVFPQMTVQENLEMGAYQRKDKANLASDFDDVFGRFPVLKERRKQTAGTLSGGEQQMLAMGRALMSRPRILLLDEPSMGLAPLLVAEIFDIIKQINEAGTTVLLVEQNANMALRIADRAYVMETGSIVLEGPASELLDTEDIKRAYLGG